MKNEKLRWIGGLRPSQNHGEGRGTDSVSARVHHAANWADMESAPTTVFFERAARHAIHHNFSFLIFIREPRSRPDHFVP